MRLAYIDFETFWSQDHSLSKMNPIAYVMHPETEIISCAIAIDNYPVDVFFGEDEIRRVLNKLDWSDTLAVAHNMSGFDAMILAWRMGIRPRMWGCTLAMARPIHAKKPGLSLAKLVEHYNIGIKDNSALVNTRGRHLKDFTPEEIDAMRTYNKDDTIQCRDLFKELKPHYTAAEMWQIDTTIRMLVEPKFVVNKPLLEETLIKERERKHNTVIELADMMGLDIEGDIGGVEEQVTEQLASASKFGAILLNRGVPVPMKPSPSDPENKVVPALAKTDPEFLALQNHPDPVVSQAALARLAIKSTLLESRVTDFLAAANATGGLLPVPLNVYGADTTGRWSGWGYNPQNLPRIIVGKPKLTDALRNCMGAPKGCVVGVADQSGIELRVNMFLWKVPYAMELFKASPDKADLYKYFAANELYHIDESEVSKVQRQVGKVAHLGLGFGAGAATFQKVAKLMGGVDMDIDEATEVVEAYRSAHAEIVRGWKTCHSMLSVIKDCEEVAIDPWGLTKTCKEGIKLPSGRIIRYPDLRRETDESGKDEWWYGQGRHKARIYAGKITENIVQALARDTVADNSLAFFRLTGLRPSLMVHDELVYIFPESEADSLLTKLQEVMRTPPKWWPDLVVWSEGDAAPTYGAAK